MSVRSAVQISSLRNGLSICRIIVFGIIGRARPADISLRTRFSCLRESLRRHRLHRHWIMIHKLTTRFLRSMFRTTH
jgi:hypothetical protein